MAPRPHTKSSKSACWTLLFQLRLCAVACVLVLAARPHTCSAQALPPGLPDLSIDWQQDNTFSQHLFLSTQRFVLPTTLPSLAMILAPDGAVAWFAPAEDNIFTFHPQPSGMLAMNVADEWYLLDSTYQPTPFPTCNGTDPDFHDLIHLPGGRSLQLCSDLGTADLSGMHTTSGAVGDSAGTVRFAVVEERDAAGNLIRSWRGIDHFAPMDTDSHYFDFPNYLELNHANALDYDGTNVLISHRNNHAVTLIDWASGQVVWQLGGRMTDFFVLGGGAFNAQHDARLLDSGRVSLMDNRSAAATRVPRGLVFALDTALGLANTVVQHAEPSLQSNSMGAYRHQPNGDGLATWGYVVPNTAPRVSYFKAAGGKGWDLYLSPDHHVYRAVLAELPFALPRPTVTCNVRNDSLFLVATGSPSTYTWNNGAVGNEIFVADTGRYQVFVPLGMGFAGSNVVKISNLANGCPVTATIDPQAAQPRAAKLVETTDIWGRVILERRPGQVYIERYSDGRCRKLVQY